MTPLDPKAMEAAVEAFEPCGNAYSFIRHALGVSIQAYLDNLPDGEGRNSSACTVSSAGIKSPSDGPCDLEGGDV